MAYRTDGSGPRTLQRRKQGATGGALQRRGRQAAIAGARHLQRRRDFPTEGRGARQVRNINSQPELVVERLASLGLAADPYGGRLTQQPDWSAQYLAQITNAMRAGSSGSRTIQIRATNPGGDGIDVTWTGNIRFYVDREHNAQQDRVRSTQGVSGQSGGSATTGRTASTTTTNRQAHTREVELHGEASGSRSTSAGAEVPVEGVPVEVSAEQGNEGTVGGSLSDSRTTEQTEQQQQGTSAQEVFSGQAQQGGDLGTTESYLEASVMADITLRAEITRNDDPSLLEMPWEYTRRLGNAINRIADPGGSQRAHRDTVRCGVIRWLETDSYQSTRSG